jgi:hypothetical protein
MECNTVLWFRFPNSRPISWGDAPVSCLAMYMATWRARTQERRLLRTVSRWIVLSLRWPEVVRWLRRTSAANGLATDSVFREFENTAGAANAVEPWQTGMGKGLFD